MSETAEGAARNPQISVSTETTTMRLPYIMNVTGYIAPGKLARVQLYMNPDEILTAAAFLKTCAEDGERDGEVDRTMNLPRDPGMSARMDIRLLSADGPLTVAAWPTGVPGLVIARHPDLGRKCDGTFSVVHARSGLRLPYCFPDPEHALGLARDVGPLADWQQFARIIQQVTDIPAYKVAAAKYRQVRCVHHGQTDGALDNDNGIVA